MKKVLSLLCAAMLVFSCASKKSDNPVLAQGSGVRITKADFLKKMEHIPEWAQGRFKTDEGKKEFVTELIKEELLYREALKKGINNDPEVKAKLDEFTRMNLISVLLKKEVEEKVNLSDEAAREYYNNNTDSFKTGYGVNARHILASTEMEAKEIREKLRKGGNFAELAKKFSKDPASAQNGGDLGFFGPGRMVPEFEKAAFSLKVGEISEPVKSNFGYHIIKVESKNEGQLRDFEEVKDSIKNRLKTEKQREIFNTYMSGLMDKNKVKIDESKLGAITFETPGAGEKPGLNPHGQLNVN